MKKNVHPWERVIRIVIGAGLVTMAFTGPENLWFLLGILPLLTGVTGVCPPYRLLGFGTCPMRKSEVQTETGK